MTLVFIHGYGVDSDMWKPQITHFSEWYSVITIDIRGHGNSKPCGEFTVRIAAEDVRNIIIKESVKEFILIGLSMGGYIIQEFAYQYGGAKGYMITGSTPIFLPVYSNFEKWALKHSSALMSLYPWKTLKKEMTKACALTSAAQDAVSSMFDKFNKKEFIGSWGGIANCLREVNFQFDAPLLVGCGDQDKTGTIKKCMKYWEEAYPGCTLFIIENASHVANLDAPDAFNQLIENFFN
jgi:pimeloyl-ACP methyl ester carboxylesterase